MGSTNRGKVFSRTLIHEKSPTIAEAWRGIFHLARGRRQHLRRRKVRPLKLEHLLQDFALFAAADHVFAIGENDLEAIAKPDHDFLHVLQADEAAAVHPQKAICRQFFLKIVQRLVERIALVFGIEHGIALLDLDQDHLFVVDELVTVKCRDRNLIAKRQLEAVVALQVLDGALLGLDGLGPWARFDFVDRLGKAFFVERLEEVVDRVQFKRLDGIFVVGRGKDDEGDMVPLQARGDLNAIEARHFDIEKRDVGFQFFDVFEGIEAVFGFVYHLDAVIFCQHPHHFLACGRLIVGNQNSELAHAFFFLCGQITKDSPIGICCDMDGVFSMLKGLFWRGFRIR